MTRRYFGKLASGLRVCVFKSNAKSKSHGLYLGPKPGRLDLISQCIVLFSQSWTSSEQIQQMIAPNPESVWSKCSNTSHGEPDPAE